jgi:hypothetical protein
MGEMETYLSRHLVHHMGQIGVSALDYVVRVLADFHPHAAGEGQRAGDIFVYTPLQGRDGRVGSRDDPVGGALEDGDVFGDFGNLGQDLNGSAACNASLVVEAAASKGRILMDSPFPNRAIFFPAKSYDQSHLAE